MKRIATMLLAVLLGTSVLTDGTLLPIAAAELPVETESNEMPTGLLKMEVREGGSVDSETVFEVDASTTDSQSAYYFSAVYQSEWDKYSTNYYYNQLSSEEQKVWDAAEIMCADYLMGIEDSQTYDTYYMTKYIECGTMEWADAYELAQIFRFSNPQYYFLNTTVWRRTSSDGLYIAFGMYPLMADGVTRQTETAKVKSQAESWIDMANAYSADAEKVRVLHDAIVNKVEYNHAVNEPEFDENIEYSQSAYSVFCTDLTVCAGYAQSFEMMCNAVGIDCIAVTSVNHEWNKVRLNDSWYNVDCTWADQSTYTNYKYYERSDAIYDNDIESNVISHTEEDMWTEYLPVCSLDTNSTRYEPGVLPAITETTVMPVITISEDVAGSKVTITSATAGADIYYTLDGREPAQAASKSVKYKQPFMIDGKVSVKAIATHDGYWDSAVANSDVLQVTYDGNGATSGEMPPTYHSKGNKITLPKNVFERKYHVFVGWNTQADGTGSFYADQSEADTSAWSGDTTLYAQWEKDETTYITGTLTSFGDEAEQTTVSLLDAHGRIAAESIVTGNQAEYVLEGICQGTYMLKVRKENHITREYPITVTGDAVEQNVEIQLSGDVNGDGNLNAKDKKILYNHIAGNSILENYEFAVGDVNNDGNINAKDKKIIYNHIAGKALLW